MRFRILIAIAILVCCTTGRALAQTTSGTIQGRIVDPQGAPVAAVAVTIAGQGNGVTRQTTTDAEGAFVVSNLPPGTFDLVLSDLALPDGTGLDVLRAIRERDDTTQVVILTAYATTENAVEAMRGGAYDYVTKPFRNSELLALVEKALEKRQITRENRTLREKIARVERRSTILGTSSAMRRSLSAGSTLITPPTSRTRSLWSDGARASIHLAHSERSRPW